jgi:hypothetical protein
LNRLRRLCGFSLARIADELGLRWNAATDAAAALPPRKHRSFAMHPTLASELASATQVPVVPQRASAGSDAAAPFLPLEPQSLAATGLGSQEVESLVLKLLLH